MNVILSIVSLFNICNALSLVLLISIIYPRKIFDALASPQMKEICDNAIDDDNDGLIDLNDPDCTCDIIKPISFIPNPSFEEMECCPNTRSQLNCATTWIQASEPTTDYVHTCGWMGWPEFPV
ncbi:MAG TPA: hypothetical protein PKD85_13660, partial [Saprospiraceae bacterium]|nr:hypothetical protein [Saprospiraceae bacterium]